jgi:hypothetical protein
MLQAWLKKLRQATEVKTSGDKAVIRQQVVGSARWCCRRFQKLVGDNLRSWHLPDLPLPSGHGRLETDLRA